MTFPGWVSLPENRSAEAAVRRMARALRERRFGTRRVGSPLYLHGPTGTGKSHLASSLIKLTASSEPALTAAHLTARDLALLREDAQPEGTTDLVVVEDVQQLPVKGAEALVQVIDRCGRHRRYLLLTATLGPAHLTTLPGRLTSRLAAGLVVCIEPFRPEGKLTFLRKQARMRKLSVPESALHWLADHLPGSGRQLEGAIARLEALRKLGSSLDLESICRAFQAEEETSGLTVEQILQAVGRYYHVRPARLLSSTRVRQTLLARQVAMYLMRDLLGLSSHAIGASLGGRDHSTVLHACRKVEDGILSDITLAAAVRQLRAELSATELRGEASRRKSA